MNTAQTGSLTGDWPRIVPGARYVFEFAFVLRPYVSRRAAKKGRVVHRNATPRDGDVPYLFLAANESDACAYLLMKFRPEDPRGVHGLPRLRAYRTRRFRVGSPELAKQPLTLQPGDVPAHAIK